MLLTVKSIRIKRMNVEIFCERGSQGRGAMFLGRLLGGRGVCKDVGHYFWGVCREQAAFARAWGIVFGAFAGASGVRRGVGQCFWGVRRGQEPRV